MPVGTVLRPTGDFVDAVVTNRPGADDFVFFFGGCHCSNAFVL